MNTQVVLITGGLTGIGRAAALAFAKKGAKVVVAGRRDEAGKALVKELRSLGSEAEFINADVRKEEDIRNAVDKTVTRFGRLGPSADQSGTWFASHIHKPFHNAGRPIVTTTYVDVRPVKSVRAARPRQRFRKISASPIHCELSSDRANERKRV